MQRVVDRGERDRDCRGESFAVQLLGGHVPIAPVEQQLRKRQALARRPQPAAAQALDHVAEVGCDSSMTQMIKRHAAQK